MAASSSDTLAAAVTLLDEQRRAEYERLVSAASKLVADGNNLAKAVKHSKKAIELMPSVPAAYQVLGDAHEAMGAPGLAAQAFIACMDRAEADEAVDKRIWADAASHAYALLVLAPREPRPSWWTDEDLLRLSARAIALLPADLRTLKWRADVLSGLQSLLPPSGRSEVEHRSPQQYRDAAMHFQALAPLLPAADAKRSMIKAGVACRARADMLEQHLASQQKMEPPDETSSVAAAVGEPAAAAPFATSSGGIEATYYY